ncbi:MAG: ASCH domain-containing protein [Pyrinomonadaceae bacterium]
MTQTTDSPHILLSIQPIYAEKIFKGLKTVELRKSFPKMSEGQSVIIYVSTPVKAIVGGFNVSKIVTAPPDEIWKIAGDQACVSRDFFDEYYADANTGHAIFIGDVWKYESSLTLDSLRIIIHNFTPPQNFRYLCKSLTESFASV